jgi:enoyl-CoA hydratase
VVQPLPAVERTGHVATLWLDNPARRNAMGPEFWENLPPLMRPLSEDPEVRAVVIGVQES